MPCPLRRWPAVLLFGAGLTLVACGPANQSSQTNQATPAGANDKPRLVSSPSPLPASSPGASSGMPLSAVASPSPSPFPSPGPNQVMAQLRSSDGQVVGIGIFTEESPGLRLNVQVRGLPPGTHGIHVHLAASCIAPDFSSAGAHFNPTERQHGLQNPSGPHGGDLPNLEVGADGAGVLTAIARDLGLGSGPTSVFDADGSALVIHAGPDDNVTDPAGNSGARIACGTIARG